MHLFLNRPWQKTRETDGERGTGSWRKGDLGEWERASERVKEANGI